MTAKTLQDIINIDSSKISISDFIDFLKNVDMEFPTPSANKEYILYAGKIGDQPISRAFFGNEEVFDVAKTTPGKALKDIEKNGVLRKKLEDAISNDYRKIGVNDFDADRIKKTMYYFMSGEIENSISTEPSFQKLKTIWVILNVFGILRLLDMLKRLHRVLILESLRVLIISI